MLIHLNGRPGVGKLTVAKHLAEQLDVRLLDNHTITNVAFSLTTFGSAAFYETIRAVRDVAFARAAQDGAGLPLILTNALTETDFGVEYWSAVKRLAQARGSRLLAVTLHCALEQNMARLVDPRRAEQKKLVDAGVLRAHVETEPLLEGEADFSLRLETTTLQPDAAASRIAERARRSEASVGA